MSIAATHLLPVGLYLATLPATGATVTEDDPLVRAAIDATLEPLRARQRRDEAIRELKTVRGWTLMEIRDHLRDELRRRGYDDKQIKGMGVSFDAIRRAVGPTR